MLERTTLVVFVVCAAAAMASADFVTDLTHRWTFEEGSLADDIGGANLTATGTYQITDGQLQCSTTAGYGYLEASVNLGSYTDLSIVVIYNRQQQWVDWTLITTSEDENYCLFGDGSGGNMFRAYRVDNSYGTRVINGSSSFATGVFHNFTYVYDRTESGGSQYLLLDGASGSGVDIYAGDNNKNNTQFQIRCDGSLGIMEEVRIYARALTASENGQIEAVPEPVTSALVALGGVGLLLRKRSR
jgi:hypothetical protein